MDDSLVYRKSGLGAAQLAATYGSTLSQRERHVLILVDGRRTVAELTDLFGTDTVQRLLPELEAKGFAKRIDPALAAEWAGAITQIHVNPPARASSGPAPRRRSEGHPLVWMTLAAVLTFSASYWATNRYRSQADALYRYDRAPLAQIMPIDAYGVLTSTDATHPGGTQLLGITPITRLPATPAVKPPAVTPAAHAAPQPASRERQAVARSESRRTPLARASASETRRPPVADSAAASAARRPRAADSASASGAKADPPAAQPLAPQVASAAETPAAPTDSPGAPPVAAPDPAPAADPPASAPQVQVAMAAPPAQPATSDPLTLHPVRHDPPQFPERALRDGIGESQVRVRLWVTPEGKVDQVDILEAKPPGVFDDEVRRALSLWTFEAPGHPADEVMELTLKP